MVAETNAMVANPVPQAIEAERRVLGIAMIDRESAVAMAEALGENDFFRPAHRMVARVIAELVVDGEAVDPVTVADCLTRKRLAPPMAENAPGGGWLAFTTSLLHAASAVLFTINASYEAKLVKRTAHQRALISAATQIAKHAYGEGDPSEANRSAVELLQSIEMRFGAQVVRAKPQSSVPNAIRAIQVPSL